MALSQLLNGLIKKRAELVFFVILNRFVVLRLPPVGACADKSLEFWPSFLDVILNSINCPFSCIFACRRVIEIFDDDGNGEVDFKEFIQVNNCTNFPNLRLFREKKSLGS